MPEATPSGGSTSGTRSMLDAPGLTAARLGRGPISPRRQDPRNRLPFGARGARRPVLLSFNRSAGEARRVVPGGLGEEPGVA